jgi:hypothetical protein
VVLLCTILIDFRSAQISERWLIETCLCLTYLCIHTYRSLFYGSAYAPPFYCRPACDGLTVFLVTRIGSKSDLFLQPAPRNAYAVLGRTLSKGKNVWTSQKTRIAMETQLLFCATEAGQDPIYGACLLDGVGFASLLKPLFP